MAVHVPVGVTIGGAVLGGLLRLLRSPITLSSHDSGKRLCRREMCAWERHLERSRVAGRLLCAAVKRMGGDRCVRAARVSLRAEIGRSSRCLLTADTTRQRRTGGGRLRHGEAERR
jgi:hypothetical protein